MLAFELEVDAGRECIVCDGGGGEEDVGEKSKGKEGKGEMDCRRRLV